MGSRDKDQTTSHHQPLLSSLVVRPSISDGGGDGGGRGSDYELGEVRREPPQYTRSDRYNDDPGSSLNSQLPFLFVMVIYAQIGLISSAL